MLKIVSRRRSDVGRIASERGAGAARPGTPPPTILIREAQGRLPRGPPLKPPLPPDGPPRGLPLNPPLPPDGPPREPPLKPPLPPDGPARGRSSRPGPPLRGPLPKPPNGLPNPPGP